MTYLRTGLVWSCVALALAGCSNLWRPFLEPTDGSVTACALSLNSTCGPAAPADASPTAVPAGWVNESRPDFPDLLSVFLARPGLAFAVGAQATLVAWQVGMGWTTISHSANGPLWESITGTGPNNMYIASSDDIVYRFDGGTTLTPMYPCGGKCAGSLTAVWTSPAGYPWVVGLANVAYKVPDGGMSWAQLAVPSSVGQNLYAVWGLSTDDVWFGSGNGSTGAMVYHYSQGTYQSYPVPSDLSINAIWGKANGEVWAVGDSGLVLHMGLGGVGFQRQDVPVPSGMNLRGIVGNNNNELWVVGDNGLILHYDGTSWQLVPALTPNSLYGVTVNPADSYPIAVGVQGTVLRLSPGG